MSSTWSLLEQMLVVAAITALKLVIKSGSATAEEKSIVSQIAQSATLADSTLNGTVWSSTPAPTPTPAT